MSTTAKTPMPSRKSKSAPHFKGDNVDDFLVEFEAAWKAAGLLEKDACAQLPQYCSGKTKSGVAALLKDEGAETWEAAKEVMKSFYSSRDKKRNYTPVNFYTYIKANKPKIKDRASLDTYYEGFVKRAQYLFAEEKLDEKEINRAFLKGLPSSLKKEISVYLRASEGKDHKYGKYPKASDACKAAQLILEDDRWGSDSEKETETEFSDDSDASDESSDSESEEEKPKKKKKSKVVVKKKKSKVTFKDATPDAVDALTEQFKGMSILLAQEVSKEVRRVLSNPRISASGAPNPIPAAPMSTALPPNSARPCFMCGQPVRHPRGIRGCPTTMDLLAAKKIKYAEDGRLVTYDGRELPPTSAGPWISHFRAAGATESRGLPHLARAATPAGLVNVDDFEMEQGIYDLYAFDSRPSQAYPAERPLVSIRKPRDQGNDLQSSRPQRKFMSHVEPPARDPVRRAPANNTSQPIVLPPGAPTPSFPPKATAPTLPNEDVVMRDSAPKQKGKDSTKKTDERSKERTKVVFKEHNDDDEPRTSYQPSYHFVNDFSSPDAVKNAYKKTLDAEITLKTRDLLAIAPGVSKMMQQGTRTRRESVSSVKSAEAEFEEYVPTEPYEVASAKTMYAMKQCSVPTEVGPARLPEDAMLDTGAELNMCSDDLPDDAMIPYDPKGSLFTVKGLHSEPLPMKGVCHYTSIVIGGLEFKAHLFVNPGPLGKFRIILGQPWLASVAAEFIYEPEGGCKVRAWVNGDRNGRSVLFNALPSQVVHQERMFATPAVVHKAPAMGRTLDYLLDEELEDEFEDRDVVRATHIGPYSDF
jgi:hypothetical protein